MSTAEQFQELLRTIGPGRMSSTAYDTSWVARLSEAGDLSDDALRWLCDNQLADGSWGAAEPFYYHDRVISTLAAMIALTLRGRRTGDRAQIDRGLNALDIITSNATTGLAADPNGATVGFEMIVPTLVAEAEKMGIIRQQGDRILGRLGTLRQMKMQKLRGRRINRFISAAFSAEMAGNDGQALLDENDLQETDGSVAHSPSATAYFLLNLHPGNTPALEYLHRWATPTGGQPNFAPIDIFEIAWSLWNLLLVPDFDRNAPAVHQKLATLKASWQPGAGIGTASSCTVKDSDDTSLVFEVLQSYGLPVDLEAIQSFEETDHYRCFTFEANPSISANIHVLAAFKAAGLPAAEPRVQKVLQFLKRNAIQDTYWYDKWHISPFYATSQIILASMEYDHALCSRAIQWLLQQQRSDGSWGFHKIPTAEETAYCLQALAIWERRGKKIPRGRLELASAWLTRNAAGPYPPLWIGKALYTPIHVVRSAVLSAQALMKSR